MAIDDDLMWPGRILSGLRARRDVAAAAAALSAQWLLRRVVPAMPFAPYSVANRIVRITPGGLATTGIDQLGHRALPILGAGIVVAALALGLAVGRRAPVALGGLAVALSFLATRVDPVPQDLRDSVAASLVAGAAAWMVAAMLAPTPEVSRSPFDARRRQLITVGALGVGLIAVFGVAEIRRMARRVIAASAVRADRPAIVPSDAAFAEVPGLSPPVTSRDDHYQIDIDIADPVVDASTWQLKISGAVSAPRSFTLDDLRAMATTERLQLLSCISNEVGGDLVSCSRWTGVPLADLLRTAQPQGDVKMVIARAIDGYTEPIPIDIALSELVLVAFGMDGLTLPDAHGSPARLLFPGRYGMRSVKWLTELSVSLTEEEGYWEHRGWDKQAIMRTSSRIDVVDKTAVAGHFVAAGIAWAGDRRISAVEVSTDDGGSWSRAMLEGELGALAWQRWQIALELPPGTHNVVVRATDGAGALQDAAERPPHPSGSSGYHRVSVRVS
jgi:DMSO/TMAO reductase YedYZ molybdopterin-dependent catalytic subunit